MCSKFEDAVDNAKVLITIIIIGGIFSALTSCSISSTCPSYGQNNHRTKFGVKSQHVWAKKNKVKHMF